MYASVWFCACIEYIHNAHMLLHVAVVFSCQDGLCVVGQSVRGALGVGLMLLGGWRGWLPELSVGAGKLEGHVHKLLPVCWGLIEKAGKGTGPLICSPQPLPCDPLVFTHSTVHVSLSVFQNKD